MGGNNQSLGVSRGRNTWRGGTHEDMCAGEALMQAELEELCGRRVNFVSRRAVEESSNWIRREAILESAEPVYVAP